MPDTAAPHVPAGPVSRSVLTEPPDDSAAVYLSPDSARSAETLQAAVDQLWQRSGMGLVFVPEGTYRFDRTVRLPRGIRLIGHGARRPVFAAAAGNDDWTGPLIHFVNHHDPASREPEDANFITFWSAINNVDFESDRPGPVVRFNVAQHSYIRNSVFRLGPEATGIRQAGNEIENCRFHGGRVAIESRRTSACWPFLMLDCGFSGQSEAAVKTCRAGVTAVRCRFDDMPTAFRLADGGDIDQISASDCRFRRVTGAVYLGGDRSHAANSVNLTGCHFEDAPILLAFAEGEATPNPSVGPAGLTVTHGICIDDATRRLAPLGTRSDLESPPRLLTRIRRNDMPPPPEPDYPDLPDTGHWFNVREEGAQGDGLADDTGALQAAIEKYDAVYLPCGRYRITDTIRLRPETKLIGLHPRLTHFFLPPGTPGYDRPERPKALVAAPEGGYSLITGIGFVVEDNPGAVALHWRAGPRSCVDDVCFLDAFLDFDPPVSRSRRSHLNLWIDGGAGVFKNIWAGDQGAPAGVLITGSEGPGVMYGTSIEHHSSFELRIERSSGWRFHAFQTEEQKRSADATAVEIANSENLTFDNAFLYRGLAVGRSHPQAILADRARDVRIRGLHVFSWGPYPFGNSIFDCETDVYLRCRAAAQVTVRPSQDASG